MNNTILKAKELISALRVFISSSENSDDENAPILINLLQSILSGGVGKVVSAMEVSNIQQMTNEQLDALSVGDIVIKKTGTQKHAYTVSYKDAENGGICLTYADAENVETVSYDHTDSGWSYNSTDSTHIAG